MKKLAKRVVVFMMVGVMATSLVACGGPSSEKLNAVKAKYNTLVDEYNKVIDAYNAGGGTATEELGVTLAKTTKAIDKIKTLKFEDMTNETIDNTIKEIDKLTEQVKTQLKPAIDAYVAAKASVATGAAQ